MRPSRKVCRWAWWWQALELGFLVPRVGGERQAKLLGDACYRSVHRALGSEWFRVRAEDASSVALEVGRQKGDKRVFPSRHQFGLGGNWDEWSIRVDTSAAYFIMSEIAGRELGARDPVLVDEVCDRVLVRGEVWRRQAPHDLGSMSSCEEVKAYLSYCEKMLVDVQREGDGIIDHPVAVALGQDGRVYKIGDGRHRLAACQVAGTGVKLEFRNVHVDVLSGILADGAQRPGRLFARAFSKALAGEGGAK